MVMVPGALKGPGTIGPDCGGTEPIVSDCAPYIPECNHHGMTARKPHLIPLSVEDASRELVEVAQGLDPLAPTDEQREALERAAFAFALSASLAARHGLGVALRARHGRRRPESPPDRARARPGPPRDPASFVERAQPLIDQLAAKLGGAPRWFEVDDMIAESPLGQRSKGQVARAVARWYERNHPEMIRRGRVRPGPSPAAAAPRAPGRYVVPRPYDRVCPPIVPAAPAASGHGKDKTGADAFDDAFEGDA